MAATAGCYSLDPTTEGERVREKPHHPPASAEYTTLKVEPLPPTKTTYEARYGAEYRFFELLVNMVNAKNVVNVVNIIEAGEEKMIYVRDI